MATVDLDNRDVQDCSRPKRCRLERILYGTTPSSKPLELEGVVQVLQQYHEYEGGINCAICGKLYKSRVCFIKHLWEHSIYWNLFAGEKNHDRVLSIQAALILYSGQTHTQTDTERDLLSLLVTSPQEKKKDVNNNDNKPETPVKSRTPRKTSPIKRKRSLSGSSTCSTLSSISGSGTPHSSMECSDASDSDLSK